jgi:hypothetical protein
MSAYNFLVLFYEFTMNFVVILVNLFLQHCTIYIYMNFKINYLFSCFLIFIYEGIIYNKLNSYPMNA